MGYLAALLRQYTARKSNRVFLRLMIPPFFRTGRAPLPARPPRQNPVALWAAKQRGQPSLP